MPDLTQKDEAVHEAEIKVVEANNEAAEEHKERADEELAKSKE